MSDISGLLAPRNEHNTDILGKSTINRDSLVIVVEELYNRVSEMVVSPFSNNPEYMRGAMGAYRSFLDLMNECKHTPKR